MIKDHNINHQIKAEKVDLVLSSGTMKKDISFSQALQIAENENMDLVEVSNKSGKIICKVADYGKIKYHQKKKQKNKSVHHVKEIKYGLNISDHDLETKHNKIMKFLEKKYTVRYILELKGREKSKLDEAMQEVNKNLSLFSEKATWKPPQFSHGKRGVISTTLQPLSS